MVITRCRPGSYCERRIVYRLLKGLEDNPAQPKLASCATHRSAAANSPIRTRRRSKPATPRDIGYSSPWRVPVGPGSITPRGDCRPSRLWARHRNRRLRAG